MNTRLRGYLSIFAAAFCWGSSATAAKFLFQRNISPMLVVQSRVIIGALFLVLFFLVFRRARLVIDPRDLLDFALLGIVGVAGSNYAYYMAIQLTNVGIAILMQYTAPAMVAAYMFLVGHEKISKVKLTAIALSLSGSAVMLGAFNPQIHITGLGIFLGMVSAVCFAFFNVYNRIATKHYSIWTAITWTLVCGGIFWVVLDLLTGTVTAHFGFYEIAILVGFSFISILLPYYFYFSGLKHLLPSTAIIVSTLEPVIAITTSFLFLGEGMEVSQIGGGLFIITAVILLEVFRE